MRKAGDTELEAAFPSDHSTLAVDETDRLIFQKRVETSRGSASQLMWIVLAVVVSFMFIVLVRPQLGGTSDAVGPDSVATTFESSSRDAPSTVLDRKRSSSVPVPASRQLPMVYRCVGKGGTVSLQSQPCPVGQRVTRAIYAPPDAEPIRRPTAVSRAPAQASTYSFGTPPANDERALGRAACASAKANREDTLARVGLRRTYDLLQRLDAAVYEACKGQ